MHELPEEIVMHIDVDFENEFKAWKERKMDRDNIIFDNSLVSDSDLLYIKHVELAQKQKLIKETMEGNLSID
jgi:hypothetical protein